MLLASALYSSDEPNLPGLLARMNDDVIKDVVRSDTLIKRFLQLRAESLGHVDDHKRKDVYKLNQNARALGRLVLQARESKPMVSLDVLLTPSNFDLVVESTKTLCRMDDGNNLNFGASIGHLLGHALAVKTGSAIRRNDEKSAKDTFGIKKICRSSFI